MSGKPLVLIGDGEFAEIAYEYFTHDSPHEVVAFAVERPFLTRSDLFGLPVVPLDELVARFPVATHGAFVAVTNTHLNRVRARLMQATSSLGYDLVSYVSTRAFVWHNVVVGSNCFVFENNVLQYHVVLEDGVILWSGNHVGHRSRIRKHTFMTSHVVVSGYCDIGENCFLGVNASIADHTTIAHDCVIGMGAVITRGTEPGKVYVGNPGKPMEKSAYDTFKVPESDRP